MIETKAFSSFLFSARLISTIADLWILRQLQLAIEQYGSKIQLLADSSTPLREYLYLQCSTELLDKLVQINQTLCITRRMANEDV
eukprot:scaffold5504_cov53-Cyclotella_meneghiniana.AAC.5